MSCAICGDVCHCEPEVLRPLMRRETKPRFRPDAGAAQNSSANWIDPEAYDASEQQFAASLEESAPAAASHFVVEPEARESDQRSSVSRPARFTEPKAGEGLIAGRETEDGETEAPSLLTILPEDEAAALSEEVGILVDATNELTDASAEQTELEYGDLSEWRKQVSAKLNSYRARRPSRAPRYPSLRLKFEPPEPLWRPPDTHPSVITQQAIPVEKANFAPLPAPERNPASGQPAQQTEASGRIIEFPRYSGPPRPLDELAEPVLERPRILEAPEQGDVNPSLGIMIEPAEEPANEKRPGFEIPLLFAPTSQRLIAALLDAFLVGLALTLFAYIFFKMTAVVPPARQAAAILAAFGGIFWAGYQYLFIVYSSTTLGLKAAGLQLSNFDGTPVPRSLRRWRALASMMSGLSLGLGYAWCFLDEDELCWHDRITHTYMAPRTTPPEAFG